MISLISNIYRRIIGVIDNPITVSLSFAGITIPIYYYILVPFLLWLNVSSNDYGNVQQFIEWFGVPYGLLLALVLVNVWTQHDTTDRAFDRESDAILALYNTFRLIEDPRLEKSAATKIKKYIEHVRRFYIKEYKENQNRLREVGDNLLNDIRKLIGKLIKRKKDKVITAELLTLQRRFALLRRFKALETCKNALTRTSRNQKGKVAQGMAQQG